MASAAWSRVRPWMSQSKIVAWNASSAPETSPRPSVDRQTDKTIAPWRTTIAANASPSRLTANRSRSSPSERPAKVPSVNK